MKYLKPLILSLFLLPLISQAFISFPDKIDTLQERINIQTVLNMVLSPSPNLKVDGVLGRVSIQTIQSFQESRGLVPDGKVGAITRLALETAQTNNQVTPTLGCLPGALFNTLNGQPCGNNSSVGLKPGCLGTTGFNTITGLPCSSVPKPPSGGGGGGGGGGSTDRTKPVVTDFTIPTTSTSLTINITTFTVTDNKEVTGYLLTESSSTPSLSSFSSSIPTTYTFETEGTKTLYAWVRDGAGNISLALSALITVTLEIEPPSPENTYYVSYSQGLDTNNGTSPSTPWKTIAKVNNANLIAGDSVLFKRGDVWLNDATLIPRSGNSINQITYSAYGTGAKPIIELKPSISGWNISDNWTQSGNNWYINFGIFTVNRIWLSGVEAQQSDSAETTNLTNRVYFDDNTSRIYLYSITNPATTFSDIQTSGYPNTINAVNVDYVTLDNLDIRGGQRSINLIGSDNWVIDNCEVGLNAGVSGLTAYAYAGVDETSNNGIIRNSTFDSGDRFYDSFQALNTMDGIWLYYGSNNWEVYNNAVKDWGHYGISVEGIVAGYTTSNNKIYNNNISNVTDYGTGIGMQGISGATFGNEVYNNTIHDVPAGVHLMDEGVNFHHNLIYDVRDCPWRTSIGTGIMIDGYSSLVPVDMEIYNNTVASCNDYAIRFGVDGTPRTGNKIINNIFYNCDVVNGYQMVVISNTSNLDNTWQNNLFYKSGISKPINFKGVLNTATEFNARNGTNGDVIENNIIGDPLFVDVLNGDFRLQAGSPAINAGINIPGFTYNGSSLDIGVYEYGVLGVSKYNFTQNLKQGVVNNEVTELQKILISNGYLNIKTPTNTFGPLTDKALKEYQKANNLNPDGMVGLKTREVLNK